MLCCYGSKEEVEKIHLHPCGNSSCFHQYSLFARFRASAISQKNWRGFCVLIYFSAFPSGVFHRCRLVSLPFFVESTLFYLRVPLKHSPVCGRCINLMMYPHVESYRICKAYKNANMTVLKLEKP